MNGKQSERETEGASEPSEIALDHARIDVREGGDVAERRKFIDLVGGLVEQTQFCNRAIVVDEAGV